MTGNSNCYYTLTHPKGDAMITADKTVMLLIDVQGRLAQLMYEKERMFRSLQIMIQGMHLLDIPIVWMEQIPENLGPTTESIARLLPGMTPIKKVSFSCCGEPKFMDRFEALGRTQVLLTGIETHICVFQTGWELIKKGCRVQVVTDCVSSRTRENKEVGLQRIIQAGGEATSVEMALFELMQAARGEAFKKIVRLIK
jgi:hypothetical protein